VTCIHTHTIHLGGGGEKGGKKKDFQDFFGKIFDKNGGFF